MFRRVRLSGGRTLRIPVAWTMYVFEGRVYLTRASKVA